MSRIENSCTCECCINACKAYPGWFAPGEAEKAAKHLGIEFEEFEKNLIKDSCSSWRAKTAPYVYSPRKVGVDFQTQDIRYQITKTIPGVCVFLKNDRCTIHEVKPYECRKVFVCDDPLGVRDEIEDLWIAAGAPLGMRPE